MKLVESVTGAHTKRRKNGADCTPVFFGDIHFLSSGSCTDQDPDLMFVEGAAQNEAKKVCTGCNVIDKCREYALTNRIYYGVWGGMTERERHMHLRAQDQAARRKELANETECDEQAS